MYCVVQNSMMFQPCLQYPLHVHGSIAHIVYSMYGILGPLLVLAAESKDGIINTDDNGNFNKIGHVTFPEPK